MKHLPHVTFTRLSAYALFVMSAGIALLVTFYVANIQIIKDWQLTIPSTTGDIHVGETFIVDSTYTKLRQVTGKSQRSLECQSDPGIFVSYPLNAVPANRAPGRTGTGVVVHLDKDMKGLPALPATCRICVALTYPILPGRTVPYFQCTRTFQLLPPTTPVTAATPTALTVLSVLASPVGNPVAPSAPSPPAVQSSEPPNSSIASSSSPQSAPEPTPSQPDNSQPAQPSLLEQVINSAKNVLK